MKQTAKQLLVVLIGLCISTLTTYAQVILSNGASTGPDIEMSAILCDTETIEIPDFSGCGTACDDECLSSKSINQTNSIWLGWVAGNVAELTFTITPNNPAANIDFVLYELENPREFNATTTTRVRCSVSTRPGPTGLREGETEAEEESTNDAANDGFLEPFFQIGSAYGLLIHSSDPENGFTIEFGGEATFAGPAPDFDNTFSGCFEDPVTYLTLPDANGFDKSQIIRYEWNFGEGASPADTILTVDEPIIVDYATLGTKTVTLTVETDAGCRVTKTIENIIDVQACCGGVGEMDDNKITLDTSFVNPVSCPSDLDGAIQIDVISRLAHTVQWTNTADDFTSTEEMLTDLGPGTYKVVATNTAQCKDSLIVQLSAPNALSASVATPFVTQCASDMGGTIFVQTTGGRQPYTYNYGLAQATQDFIAVDSLVGVNYGAYEVTVRDVTGCETKDTAFIVPLNIEVTTADLKNTACKGDSTGSVTLETFSGAAPYTYDFGNGLNGGDELLTALPTGDYVVTVTDANQCTGTVEVPIGEPTDFGAFIDGTGFTYECFGGDIASLTAEPTGGLTPYEYIWSTGETTKEITNLKADTYKLTVTDANGCTVIDEGDISQPDSLIASIVATSDASCFDTNDGKIKVSAAGGTGAYELSFNDIGFQPFPLDSTLTRLEPKAYSIIIRDENGCESVAVDTTLSSPSEIIATDSTTLATCRGGRDGSIIINASGGMAPYTFDYANPPTGFSATNDLGRIDTVPIGIYTVLITDANGCTQPINGIEVSELELMIDTLTIKDLACGGSTDFGAVELVIENSAAAQGPFLYDLFDGNGPLGDSVLTTLVAGDYTIDVYDANGCQGTAPSFTIEEPLVPLTLSPNYGNIKCFGAADGSAIVIPSGGTPDYTIAWSTGETGRQINDLDIGDYTVTVTDANNCSEEAAFTLTQNAPITINEINPIAVDCPDDPSGAIGFDLEGGIAPYQYSLDDGATFQDLPVDGDSATITALVAGDYVISIIDVENCTATVTGSVTSPAEIEAFVLGGDCYGEPVVFSDASFFTKGEIINWTWDFGAEASLPNATGPGPHEVVYTTTGTPEVTLTVETDLGCTVTKVINGMDNPNSPVLLEPCCDINAVSLTVMADSTSCADMADGRITLAIETPDNAPATIIDWDTGADTEMLTNLGTGTYEVTVTNQATCSATTSAVIASPEALTSVADKTDPSCGGLSNGIIRINSTGGTMPYTYSFGADFQDENILENLSVGNYDIFIQDANNCRNQVTVNLAEKELVTEDAIITPPNCFGEATGQIVITTTNGTAPYQYNLNGAGLGDASSLLNLEAGNYNIEILDAEQCTGSKNVIISQPDAITVNLVGNMISCFGETDGRLIATPAGGAGNYTYSWRNEANQVVSTEAIAADLPQGNYFLTLTDGQGCDTTQMGLVVEPPELAAVANVQNVLCEGEANGAIIPQGVGGTPPYAYSQDGILFFQTETIPNLESGDYTVFVRDAGGCEAETSAFIDEPGAFTIVTSQDLDINLGTEVQLEAIVSDPTGVNFLWTGPDSLSCNNCPDPRVMPSQSGTYTITATTDQGDCTATETIFVAVNFDRPVYIPNAFSPNGDGINDNFYIAGGPAVENIVRLSIFDRFGTLLYDQSGIAAGDPTNGWDGRFNGDRMHTGVYVVKADIQFIDGELITYTRDLTLIAEP